MEKHENLTPQFEEAQGKKRLEESQEALATEESIRNIQNDKALDHLATIAAGAHENVKNILRKVGLDDSLNDTFHNKIEKLHQEAYNKLQDSPDSRTLFNIQALNNFIDLDTNTLNDNIDTGWLDSSMIVRFKFWPKVK